LIDPRAAVDAGARIEADVHIGPWSVIGPDVTIAAGTRIGPHVVIYGPTHIGRDNEVHPFASLGGVPQDKKFAGEVTELHIGDRNVIREYCTLNRGTAQGGGMTRVGNDNWIMAYCHIAHDCQVGSHTVLANGTSLAGHVTVEDYATLGGFTLVHQFCCVGAYSFSAMGSGVAKDVPPYTMVSGNPAHPHGINTEGLKRHGFGPSTLRCLRQAYRILYRSNLSLEEAKRRLQDLSGEDAAVGRVVDFLNRIGRGIVR
jgi:UDP-N-acetylglucosamine acyltransferase